MVATYLLTRAHGKTMMMPSNDRVPIDAVVRVKDTLEYVSNPRKANSGERRRIWCEIRNRTM